MKKVVKYCLVGLIGISIAACGSNEPKAEQVENHEGHDHANENAVSGDLTIDQAQSALNWEGGIMSIGDEYVKSHNGTIVIKDGRINFENGQIKAGKMVVDMTTITPLDDNYQPEEGKSKEKLVGHLSSADFFNTSEYPEAFFSFGEVKNGTVNGEMTIRGITNNEEVKDVVVNTLDGVTTVTGHMTIDRQKYGVAFDLGAQDMFLSDNINFTFSVVLK